MSAHHPISALAALVKGSVEPNAVSCRRTFQSGLKHEVFELLAAHEAIEMAATTLHRRSAVASLLLELCGVISTLGNSWNGRRDGLRSGSAWVGYCHQTSSAAPPRWPSFSAVYSEHPRRQSPPARH